MTQHQTTLSTHPTSVTSPPAPTAKVAPPTALKRPPPVLDFVAPEDISKFVNMLIVGRPNAGKTLLATSAAEDERIQGILYVDVERGAKTGIDYLKKYRNKIHTVYVGDDPIADMNKIIRYAKVATDPVRAKEEGLPYIDMVVIDSITALSDKVVRKISDSDRSIEHGEVPRGLKIQEWGTNKSFIETWILTLKHMDCHLVVTCIEQVKENEITKVKEPALLLPGQLASNLPALFDEVFWLGVDKNKPKNTDGTQPRVILCVADKTYTEAKTRSPRSRPVPPSIGDPTMKILFNFFFDTP